MLQLGGFVGLGGVHCDGVFLMWSGVRKLNSCKEFPGLGRCQSQTVNSRQITRRCCARYPAASSIHDRLDS